MIVSVRLAEIIITGFHVPYVVFTAQSFEHGVQDRVLDDVPVDLFSSVDFCHLGDDRRQTQGGVVCQRHVSNLCHGENTERQLKSSKLQSVYRRHGSPDLVGVETVVYDGADEVQVQGPHLPDLPGGVLEGGETHVVVNFIQVSTVEGIELEMKKKNES